MKEIKFNTKAAKNQLIVDVELPARRFKHEPVIHFTNSEMIEYLRESGTKIEDYELTSQPDISLTSYAEKENPPILEGTWIFSKKPAKQKKVNKPKPRSYNKSKEVTKSGD